MSDLERGLRIYHRPCDSIKAPWAVSERKERDDIETVNEIIHIYRSGSERISDKGTIWDTIFCQLNWPVHQILLNGSIDECADVLRNPGSNNLFWGFDNLVKEWTEILKADEIQCVGNANRCYDNLLRFAEALGCIPVDNPEDERTWLKHANMHPDDIIDRIEKYIGFALDFPNPFPDEFGLKTSRGVCSYRSIQAAYLGWRIRCLTKHTANPRILEIGAGVGRSAYYARMFGIHDYTIVDLPFSNVSQAYYLITTLGRENVALHGESHIDIQNRVKVLNTTDLFNRNDCYDLIVNMDSITEFGARSASEYFEKIGKCTKRFLSINHECNDIRVSELAESARTAIERSIRYPYWLRPGYVEEIVEFA